MVGVGIDGAESALARVSLVNYYGFVILDAFVRSRERVVDYRTEFSGIRPSDMVHGTSSRPAPSSTSALHPTLRSFRSQVFRRSPERSRGSPEGPHPRRTRRPQRPEGAPPLPPASTNARYPNTRPQAQGFSWATARASASDEAGARLDHPGRGALIGAYVPPPHPRIFPLSITPGVHSIAFRMAGLTPSWHAS